MPAASELRYVYLPFADVRKSTTKTTDGIEIPTRIVSGIMTDETVDLDGEIVDYDSAKSAATDWFRDWANVREQHGHNAIGTGIELACDDVKKEIRTTIEVVDPLAIVKIDKGVLKGQSVGLSGARKIKDALAPRGRLVGFTQIEDSLVDRPSNPKAKIAVTKSAKDGSLEEGEALQIGEAEIQKIATASENKLAETEPDADVDKTTTITITTDEEVQVTEAVASSAENPLDDTAVEPEAARVVSAVDADLGGSLNPVESTDDKATTPEITKSEEDLDMLYAKAFPQIKDLLTKGDTAAALAVIQATELLTKAAIPAASEAVRIETKVVAPAPEPEAPAATEPIVTTDKGASPDTLKAAISEAVTKAVETAVKSLQEKVEAMEKRAHPGGPMLGGTKLLGAPDEIKAQALKVRIEDVRKMADEHPDGTVRQGARQILAEFEKSA